jgi:hypothetical protein
MPRRNNLGRAERRLIGKLSGDRIRLVVAESAS